MDSWGSSPQDTVRLPLSKNCGHRVSMNIFNSYFVVKGENFAIIVCKMLNVLAELVLDGWLHGWPWTRRATSDAMRWMRFLFSVY
jgi:hypothetical protein